MIVAVACCGLLGQKIRWTLNGSPIPIEEAIKLADIPAKKWNDGAQLLFVISQDTPPDLETSNHPGLDGRRRAWYLRFKDPATNQCLGVDIKNGKVTDVSEEGMDTRPGIIVNEIHVSGSTLANIAKQLDVKPGIGFAAGYHFVLAHDVQLGHYIEVLGVNKQGVRQHLVFDPRTGRQLSVLSD